MKYQWKLVFAALALAACEDTDISAPEQEASFAATAVDNAPGVVYTLTNQPSGNAIAIFDRASDGVLAYAGEVQTGGLGTGGGLGSQGAIVASENHRWLLAVNAASNDVSVFEVRGSRPVFVQRIASGGQLPVSVAIRNNLVYVLNAGGTGNIAGLTLGSDGRLTPLDAASQPLSAANAGAAQVSFTPDGGALVVTERFTNAIDVYTLNRDGTVNPAQVFPSHGETPFGFDFDKRGRLIVSEAFGGATDGSAASSYFVRSDRSLSLVTGSLLTTETAACWLVVSKDGSHAYTANNGSNSITGYSIGRDGSLSLLDVDGVTASTADGAGALDLALSTNGRFLYVLGGGNETITGFLRNNDGSLEPVTVSSGLADKAVGLVAF